MQTGFLRVTKDNATRDRGLIAIDAICSIFENQEAKNVSIMTMDGFWYDVVDDLGSLYEKIVGDGCAKEVAVKEAKKDYFRKKRMMTPSTANERAQQNHEDFVTTIHNERKEECEDDVFRPAVRTQKKTKRNLPNNISRSLPSGEGEGHYDMSPKPMSRDASRDLKGL